MTTPMTTPTLIRQAEQFQANAFGGILQANKPVVGGSDASGQPSSALFYWSHSHFTDDFEFGLHRHEGFEIVTFVLDGVNSHFDTAGSTWVPLGSGDVQIIRSGSGISHNERVAKGTRAFQIWFDPDYHAAVGVAPDYADHPAASFPLTHNDGLATIDYIGAGGPIESRVEGLSVRRLRADTTVDATIELGPDRYSVAYVIEGPITVDGDHLHTNDALIARGSELLHVEASAGTDLFIVSVPAHPGYTPVRG